VEHERGDYDQGEGFELVDTILFSQGEWPYRSNETYPFYASNYPPLFHVILVPFAWVFGPAYWYGRLAGFVGTLITAAAIGLIVSREERHRGVATLAGLAFLALGLMSWGKFFHPLGTAANLLQRGGTSASDTDQRPKPFRPASRALALQACAHCGQCSLHCSVAPSHQVLGNRDILPMDKLDDLRRHLRAGLQGAELGDLAEGSQICTECLRCTQICPAGIDLQDLWMASKQTLAETGQPGVDGQIRKRTAGQWAQELATLRLDTVGGTGAGLADRAESFWGCVQCTTCTGVCPVVAVSEDPSRDLDLTPQQIMNLLRMGLKRQTLGARMVWSCTTCYKCQEHCPQGVPVADILYELRGLGAEILRDARGRS